MSSIYDDGQKGPKPAPRHDLDKAAPPKDTRDLRDLDFAQGEEARKIDANATPAVGRTITACKGEVLYKLPRETEWQAAAPGLRLPDQAQVSTGADASVSFVFDDGSDFTLGANAIVVFYKGAERNVKTREHTKTQVLLRDGSVPGGLGALDGKADKRAGGAGP